MCKKAKFLKKIKDKNKWLEKIVLKKVDKVDKIEESEIISNNLALEYRGKSFPKTDWNKGYYLDK